MSKEGWDSRDDGPYWGCLTLGTIFAVLWLVMLIRLGVFS